MPWDSVAVQPDKSVSNQLVPLSSRDQWRCSKSNMAAEAKDLQHCTQLIPSCPGLMLDQCLCFCQCVLLWSAPFPSQLLRFQVSWDKMWLARLANSKRKAIAAVAVYKQCFMLQWYSDQKSLHQKAKIRNISCPIHSVSWQTTDNTKCRCATQQKGHLYEKMCKPLAFFFFVVFNLLTEWKAL